MSRLNIRSIQTVSPLLELQKMLIRDFEQGEEAMLRRVFMSSVHELASGFYTKEQLNAWAPRAYDERQWAEKISALRPFVAIIDGCIAGYSDLQESGFIGHFFVSGEFSRRGVGSALMEHIQKTASQRKISELSANVSRAAESLFVRFLQNSDCFHKPASWVIERRRQMEGYVEWQTIQPRALQ